MCEELSEVAYYRGWPTSLGVNLRQSDFVFKVLLNQLLNTFLEKSASIFSFINKDKNLWNK
jgi:hypothetical protein